MEQLQQMITEYVSALCWYRNPPTIAIHWLAKRTAYIRHAEGVGN